MENEKFLLSEKERDRLLEIRDTFYKIAPHILSVNPNKEGIMEFRERRFVLLNTSTFSKIHDAIEKILGPALRKQLLFKFGEKAGKDIANMFLHISFTDILKLAVKIHFDLKSMEKLKGNKPLEIAYKILGYGKHAGWLGNSEITHFSENPPYARAIIHNSFESFALKDKSPSQPVCNFLSGVVNGVMKVLLNNENLITREVKCYAKGDEYCEFITEGAENGNK